MLSGSDLLAKVKELGDVSKSDLVRACGYVSTKKNGSERLNFTAFYEALLEAKVRFNQDLQPICWVFDLFRSLDTENLNLEDFSLKIREDFIDTPLSQLKDDINKEFYELSLAHYQRYIQPSFFT